MDLIKFGDFDSLLEIVNRWADIFFSGFPQGINISVPGHHVYITGSISIWLFIFHHKQEAEQVLKTWREKAKIPVSKILYIKQYPVIQY